MGQPPGIDAWGNLNNRSGVTGKTMLEPLACSVTSKNQQTTCYTYDAAGNIKVNGSNTYVYDAENRIIATGGYSYAYDGDGQRIKKCTQGTTPGTCSSSATGMFYWRSLDGSPQAESDLGGNWTEVYGNVNGKLAFRADLPSNTVRYYFQDHLGSTDVITGDQGNIIKESDYYPYGGEIQVFGSDSNRYKFTGKERDAESGNDYFGARYYGSSMGRWLSPDWSAKEEPVPYAKVDDPQTLNLYGYVRNNPLSNVDADGHACSGALGNTGSGFCTRADTYAVFDTLVHDKTRFFAAASAATQELADVAVPVLGHAGTSQSTRDFLENTGEVLLTTNQQAVQQIQSGEMSGSGTELDNKMVHVEQTVVQLQLNDLQSKNPSAYNTAIKELNGLLNGKSSTTANVLGALGSAALSTDGAYAKVLASVRKDLGHDIDFANQGDREAIGKALVQHVRGTGGCDIAGSKANGCRH